MRLIDCIDLYEYPYMHEAAGIHFYDRRIVSATIITVQY